MWNAWECVARPLSILIGGSLYTAFLEAVFDGKRRRFRWFRHRFSIVSAVFDRFGAVFDRLCVVSDRFGAADGAFFDRLI